MRILRTASLSLLLSSPAFADVEPFFNGTGIDPTQWYVSAGWRDADWNYCWWKPAEVKRDGDNAKFTIESKADFTGTNNDIPVAPDPKALPQVYACGKLQSPDVSRYGLYQARLKTASGSGLNSNFYTYNMYPHDEIDFEFLGLHPTQVSINYWVGGANMSLKPINLGFDASQDFHTYAFDWEPDSITYYVDGKQVFKTAPGAKMPSHYSYQYVSLWAGYPGWMGKFTYTTGINAEFAWVAYTPSAQASPYYGKTPYSPGMDTSQPITMQPLPVAVAPPTPATTPASVMRPTGTVR